MDSSRKYDAPKPNSPFPTSPELAGAELPWPLPLYVAGDPPPSSPRPIPDHQKVRLDLLSIFPHFPPTSGDSPRWETPSQFLPCSVLPSRDLQLKETNIPGSNLQNVHELQNSELVKYITIRRKIVKMKTQLFWNPWNKICIFCYIHIFIFCFYFNLY